MAKSIEEKVMDLISEETSDMPIEEAREVVMEVSETLAIMAEGMQA